MSNKKYIRFIDSSYNTLFHVPNGGSIRIKFENGDTRIYPCKYIDSTHAHIGQNVFHICEFAERMEQSGRTYEPVAEIGDLAFYETKYFDRDNIGADGKPVPYYCLIEQTNNRGTSAEVKTSFGFCLTPTSQNMTFCKFTYEHYSGKVSKTFAADIEEVCNDPQTCKRIKNIVASIKETLNKEALSLDEHIANCVAQTAERGPAETSLGKNYVR